MISEQTQAGMHEFKRLDSSICANSSAEVAVILQEELATGGRR